MALSEEEQKLLAQMEAALAADDPKLANMLRGTGSRKLHRRRASLAGLGFVLGLVALVAGMKLSIFLSIAGFLIMLVAAIVGLNSWSHVTDEEIDPSDAPKQRTPQGGGDSNEQVKQFMEKMEERWRRRQDDGF